MDLILGVLFFILGGVVGFFISKAISDNKMFAAQQKFRTEKRELQGQLNVAMRDKC